MRRWVFALLVMVLPTATASAQEKGQVGLGVAYPGAVSFIFHPSDSVAVRPDFTFSWNSQESSGTNTGGPYTSSSKNRMYGVGISALFYGAKWEKLRTYFSPRFGYQRTTYETAGTMYVNSGATNSTNYYTLSGAFGAQYALAQRFAVFGETGLAYTRQSASTTASSMKGNALGLRTAFGGIFYFN